MRLTLDATKEVIQFAPVTMAKYIRDWHGSGDPGGGWSAPRQPFFARTWTVVWNWSTALCNGSQLRL